MQKLLTTKTTFLVAFLSAIAFALPLLAAPEAKWLIPFCIFGCKFGLSVGFNMIYFVNAEIFPTLFVSFAFTIGNIFSRSATILAPEVAELEAPRPMQCFCVTLIVAACALFLLNPQNKTKVDKENK